MGEVVVQLEGISKYFGSQRILTGINLSISKGEVLGIVGPNGSGKSTLLKIVLGLVYPTEGKMTSDSGDSISMGALLDRPGFFPGASLEKNLAIFSGDCSFENFEEEVARLGLKPYLRKKFRLCSTGIQKRCELAAALLQNPDLLVLDEPVSGLDPAGIYALRSVIKDMQAKKGAVLMADHSLNELEKICTRICFLRQGIVQAVETPEKLLKQFSSMEEAYRYYNLKIS